MKKGNTNNHNHPGLDKIIVRGARTHNLKNITVEMPRNAMVVFTGVSGSGKSSLAFDTIFAEGQRRYVESLSAYARQFLHQMQKPDVDEIVGLSPAISIDQKSASHNPRSTVATTTEIYDYLRVLYSRVGKPHCLICDREIKRLSNEEILHVILAKTRTFANKKDEKARIYIMSPVVRGRKGEYYQLLYDMLGKGFARARVDGNMHSLRDRINLARQKKHDIDIIVDEIEAIEFRTDPKGVEERYSEAIERGILESEGLVRIMFESGKGEQEEFLMSTSYACPYDGFSYPEVEPRLFSFNSPYGACPECNGLGTKYFGGSEVCPACEGKRLRPEALHVFIGKKNIVEVTSMSVSDAADFFIELPLTDQEKEITRVVIKEIENRLSFMLDVGLDYLTLDRRANTLSGGEAQRIRLASQLGSQLVGALYVLDEPTIGLHQRDNDRLIKTLQDLRNLGNTIVIVEHDEDTIFASDYLVDIGPAAGVHGGNVVVAGWLDEMLADKKKFKSLTLDYLRGDKAIEIPEERRTQDKGSLKIRGGNVFNIKNLNVDVPLGKMVVITGVSGSGKSSFLYHILHENLRARFDRKYRSNEVYNAASFTGTEYLYRSILIDQSPIGRTPRSNPATYTGAFTFIRDIFAESEEARIRGWGPSRFSFNVKGGRCEACEGNGVIAVEMHFLPTVYVTCDVCKGKRYQKETLDVKYKGKSIYDVLKMTIEEALPFFEDIPAIYDRLQTLMDVGLGYLEIGQPATTLSGGEAQRVKIASELYRPQTQKTLYLLDEPTVGLHYDDVQKLLAILQTLVDRGNTVVIIEHNLDVVKCADHILDFGPEGGANGGQVIAKGTPEDVANNTKSHTGTYLKKVLKKAKGRS